MVRESGRRYSGMYTGQIIQIMILAFAFGSYLLLRGVPAHVVDRLLSIILILTLGVWITVELMVKFRPGWIETLVEGGFLEVGR